MNPWETTIWDEKRKKQAKQEAKRERTESRTSSIRKWINLNSPTVTVGAIAVLVLSMFLISQYPRRNTPGGNVHVYFYDAVTREYFVDDARKLPPIESPSGHDAVRAYFYTCGECDNGDKFLGYYEKYTAKALKALRASRDNYDSWMLFEEVRDGQLLSADGKKWVSAWSREGDRIIQDLYTRCEPNGNLRPCPPPDQPERPDE